MNLLEITQNRLQFKSAYQLSLSTSTATNLNMGSCVNIGNGVNINGDNVNIGSGVAFGSHSSITAGTDSSVTFVQSSTLMTSKLNTPEINLNKLSFSNATKHR